MTRSPSRTKGARIKEANTQTRRASIEAGQFGHYLFVCPERQAIERLSSSRGDLATCSRAAIPMLSSPACVLTAIQT
jgi:hypothetical protein